MERQYSEAHPDERSLYGMFGAGKKTEDFLRQLGFDFSRARKYPDRMEIQVPRARVPELLQEQNAKKLGDFFAKNKVKNFEISREGYRHGCM